MEDREETQQQELFPDSIRRIGYATSLFVFAACCVYLYCYSQKPDEYNLTPSMLGVNNLIVLSAFAFLFFKVRWAKVGVKVSKLGPMEFSHIIEGQSKEHTEDIAAIEERLKELESSIVAAPTTTTKNGFELELERKIIEFLEKWPNYSFSPQKMQKWHENHNGDYQIFSKDPTMLRRQLRQLVKNGKLSTRVSKQGNTLYIINSR